MPVMLLMTLSSCNHYYKAITTAAPNTTASFNDFKDTQKYYILRNGKEAYAMKNISISDNRENLQCTLEDLPMEHQVYAYNGDNPKLKYKTSVSKEYDETMVLDEVHIYVMPGTKTEKGAYTLPMANVQKAEIIEPDTLKTKKSQTTGTTIAIIATVVGVGLILGIVAASSLAFVF